MVDKTTRWDDPRFLNLFIMADLINQPIHIITPDGIIRFVNNAWCTAYGFSKEEAVGRHIEKLIQINNYYLSVDETAASVPSEHSYRHLEKAVNRSAGIVALEKGRPVSLLTQTPDLNKVLVTSTPIFDDEGEIICVFTLVQDFTLMAYWRDSIEEETQKSLLVQQELQYLRSTLAESNLIGSSKSMVNLRKMISVVGPSDASVLISGESGTGKEVVAKEIYVESLRKDKPLITVNCAAIPENLLESELFGHEKGAFTGAVSTKIGLFELANTGTILLDEIGEFPLYLQPKLLRVLQEREFRRVGGTKQIPVDVRVIAATNRDLMAMTKSGEFRMDLYYRLNVFSLQIPPLRQRREDVPLLASAFLEQFNTKYKKSKIFTRQALLSLEQHDWPGNVRELENAVERIVVIGDQPAVTAEHVAVVMGDRQGESSASSPLTLKEAVANLERNMISEALATYKTTYKAAEALGSTQSTIARKAKALGITSR